MKCKICSVIFTLFVVGCSEYNFEKEIAFKDIPLDVPGYQARIQSECKQLMDDNPCNVSEYGDFQFHVGRISYGNLDYSLDHIGQIISTSDGSLIQVSVHGKTGELLELKDIIKDKYGSPVSDVEVVINGLGHEFEKNIFRWEDSKGAEIVIESLYQKVGQGRVVITSPHFVKELRSSREEKSDEAIRNL